jgi:tetratricopeptide (TPR) repeat protein
MLHARGCAPRTGHRLDSGGSPAQAQESLDKYLSLFPDHEPAMFARAVALQQLGRHGEAVEQYRKVLARNPRSEEALSNLVALFLDRRDGESVRRYAAMLAELRPGSSVALEALATLAFRRRGLSGCRALRP